MVYIIQSGKIYIINEWICIINVEKKIKNKIILLISGYILLMSGKRGLLTR